VTEPLAMSETPNFHDNIERQRFELIENDLTAFADYSRQVNRLTIPHVESPPQLRGKGTAARLMSAIADYAVRNDLRIVPLCGYARAWFRHHPERADILA
jgi:predicted GNAT family acetyltransferase